MPPRATRVIEDPKAGGPRLLMQLVTTLAERLAQLPAEADEPIFVRHARDLAAARRDRRARIDGTLAATEFRFMMAMRRAARGAPR